MASPALQMIVHILTSRPAPENPSVADMRQGFEMLAAKFPLTEGVQFTPVDAGGVPAAWIDAPNADPGRTILYLHGGGYVIGSIATHRELANRLSQAAAARVLLLDYRLAPEHPFPAAVDDAVSAYRWLMQQGTNPARNVIAGDSAGGGLAVAALIALRDAGLPRPAAGVCLSPWTDMEGIGDSMASRAHLDPMVQRGRLLELARLYLQNANPRSPLAAPLYADLKNLPPLLVHVGTSETLYDDATRLADKARAAGVEVTLEPWEEMIHVWHIFAPMLPEGQQAIERVGAYIRQQTA